VCWIAASTDPGEIYAQSQAFYDRLAAHVVWHPAGKKEIVKIIQLNYPDLPVDACEQVAHYVLVPRKALAFAEQMVLKRNESKCSWAEAAKIVAGINHIDDFGMFETQVRILKALGQGPVARTNLPVMAGCRTAELERIHLPPLFDNVEGRGQLLRPTRRGFTITRAGIKELDKRNIPHQGDRVTAEYTEGL
jgi:hypothetical protein